MLESTVFSLLQGTAIIDVPGRGVALRSFHLDITLGKLTPELMSALQVLRSGGAPIAQLLNAVSTGGGAIALAGFYKMFRKMDDAGLICQTLLANGQRFATRVPSSNIQGIEPVGLEPNTRYALSRFAYCHKEDDLIILESPLSFAKIILHSWRAVGLLSVLAKPHSLDEILTAITDTNNEVLEQFVNILLKAGMLSAVAEDGSLSEDKNSAVTQWEFQDLLFHARSREGRHRNRYGRVTRSVNLSLALPSVKPQVSDDVIQLYCPDIGELEKQDSPFTAVLEKRVSVRGHGKTPITDKQLGGFLYRVAGVRSSEATDEGGFSRRPYPSGGACYELELYLAINNCQKIHPGMYHYDPYEHKLRKLSVSAKNIKALSARASRSGHWPTNEVPQVLIIITARVQRPFHRYGAMAYALVLKNLGGLYQTMYLVATAMQLAPCALGGGDSDLFARATGLDYYAEPSVGEFLLGSKPETEQPSVSDRALRLSHL